MSAPSQPRRWMGDEEIARAKRLRATGFSYQQIADILGRSKPGIAHLAARGWKRLSRDDRRCPGDLSYQASRLNILQLQAHYGCGNKLLKAWLAEKRITPPNWRYHCPKRECPADFLERAAVMNSRLLTIHYGTRSEIVRRWRIQHGLPVRPSKHDHHGRPVTIGWVERYVAERRVGA